MASVRLHTDRCNHRYAMCDRWKWSRDAGHLHLPKRDSNEYSSLFVDLAGSL